VAFWSYPEINTTSIMRKVFTLMLALALSVSAILAQNKNTIFYDSAGQVTTFEGHWAQVVDGRFKSVYNKAENAKALVRMTKGEFEIELAKTDKRIRKKHKLRTEFPDFDVIDIDGNRITKDGLKGKVVVVNFWFIGCAPCEMERPALNELQKRYEKNGDVVFIAFANNNKEQLDKFLVDHPIRYVVIPTESDFIKRVFELNSYPANIIVGKDGKFFFNSLASGIGIATILQREIDKALRI